LGLFAQRYNKRIRRIARNKTSHLEPSLTNKLKLEKSLAILGLEDGSYPDPRYRTQHWDAYIRVHSEVERRWCDVQVNYQVNLGTLRNNIDAWIMLWDSMCAPFVISNGVLVPSDLDIGSKILVPPLEIQRIQVYAAMWRLARHCAEQFTPEVAFKAATQTPLVLALITYVLVASAVTITSVRSSTKNSFLSSRRRPQDPLHG
jgi:hypothetical protein